MAVVNPRPVVDPIPSVATPPDGEPAATAAFHAARREVRESFDKQVKYLEEWKRHDGRALAEIQPAVKPHFLNLVMECSSATEAWAQLRTLFEDETTARRADLEGELSSLALRSGESIIKYVGTAKNIRDDLAIGGAYKDNHSLSLPSFRGLPAGYTMIITVLNNKDAPLRLPFVTARLLGTKKELQAVCNEGVPPAVQAYLAALTVKTSDKEEKKGDSIKKPVCFSSEKPGHKIAECHKRKPVEGRRPWRRKEQRQEGR